MPMLHPEIYDAVITYLTCPIERGTLIGIRDLARDIGLTEEEMTPSNLTYIGTIVMRNSNWSKRRISTPEGRQWVYEVSGELIPPTPPGDELVCRIRTLLADSTNPGRDFPTADHMSVALGVPNSKALRAAIQVAVQ